MKHTRTLEGIHVDVSPKNAGLKAVPSEVTCVLSGSRAGLDGIDVSNVEAVVDSTGRGGQRKVAIHGLPDGIKVDRVIPANVKVVVSRPQRDASKKETRQKKAPGATPAASPSPAVQTLP